MPDYKQGKIYKIVSDECDAVYYGSTVQSLIERWWLHKAHFNNWKKTSGWRCAIIKYFDEYGIDNFRIELVEDYPCDNDEQLRMKEQEYLDANECVNEIRAYRSIEDERVRALAKYYKKRDKVLIKNRQKITCEACGISFSRSSLWKHNNSANHKRHI